MSDLVLDAAKPSDVKWMKPLFDPAIFWDFNRIWYRYWNSRSRREFWRVVRPLGFVHYRVRKDGIKSVEEIAVDASQRRRGVGRFMLQAIGYPIILKTNTDNEVSNNFYLRLGFSLVKVEPTKSGSKFVNVYFKGLR